MMSLLEDRSWTLASHPPASEERHNKDRLAELPILCSVHTTRRKIVDPGMRDDCAEPEFSGATSPRHRQRGTGAPTSVVCPHVEAVRIGLLWTEHDRNRESSPARLRGEPHTADCLPAERPGNDAPLAPPEPVLELRARHKACQAREVFVAEIIDLNTVRGFGNGRLVGRYSEDDVAANLDKLVRCQRQEASEAVSPRPCPDPGDKRCSLRTRHERSAGGTQEL